MAVVAIERRIVDEINAAHERAHGAARTAVEHAWECGRLLAEAKAQTKHGEWAAWVEANCAFGERQARRYMQLHHKVADPKSVPGDRFDLKRLLAEPSQPAEQPADEGDDAEYSAPRRVRFDFGRFDIGEATVLVSRIVDECRRQCPEHWPELVMVFRSALRRGDA